MLAPFERKYRRMDNSEIVERLKGVVAQLDIIAEELGRELINMG
jgi:hypothetical protein